MSTKTELTEKVSSVTLRIPVKLKRELRALARREHRSLNAQCVHLLERFWDYDEAIARGSKANEQCSQQLARELLGLAENDAIPASCSQDCKQCDASTADAQHAEQ